MAANDLISLETVVQSVNGLQLVLESVLGLSVGDSIIVESLHGYDKEGVDGVWSVNGLPDNYYFSALLGRSFVATVIAVNGNTVTVDRAVPAACQGNPCYRNNAQAVKYAITNLRPWPYAQRFACAEQDMSSFPVPLQCYLSDASATIDFRNCAIFAPRGCGAICIRINRRTSLGGGGVRNKVFKNLTIVGNARDFGYGVIAIDGDWQDDSSTPAAFDLIGDTGAQPTVVSNVFIENFTFVNNWQDISLSYAADCVVYNCKSYFSDPKRATIASQYSLLGASRCSMIDCTIHCDYGRLGFFVQRGLDVTLLRCGGTNCLFAVDTSGRVLIEQCSSDWTDVGPDDHIAAAAGIFNISRRYELVQDEVVPNTGGGTVLRNCTVTYTDIPFVDDYIFNTVVVEQGELDVLTQCSVRGLSLEVPRSDVTTVLDGYLVRSEEQYTLASDLTGQLDSGAKYVRQGEPVEEDEPASAQVVTTASRKLKRPLTMLEVAAIPTAVAAAEPPEVPGNVVIEDPTHGTSQLQIVLDVAVLGVTTYAGLAECGVVLGGTAVSNASHTGFAECGLVLEAVPAGMTVRSGYTTAEMVVSAVGEGENEEIPLDPHARVGTAVIGVSQVANVQ